MSTAKTIPIATSKHSPNPGFWPLLAWAMLLLVTTIAILSLRGPRPVKANAPLTMFSAERALAHVRAIASVPHPIGSTENESTRKYLVARLLAVGFNPHVFRATGAHVTRQGIALGQTYDVVGRLQGTENSRAVMLVAHYDSVLRAPGAADDGAGVAAILETARALRASAPLKNDVIVLLTDGEEAGLLGADAFATSHPWMKDVGLIMNFEARGNKGPSLLFETGTGNASLINTVAQSASHTVGSSLFYSLYKLLPNDTDFTVFRRENIPGLNFAFGENLEAYHSQLDTPGALSLSSLQHHGSYALNLTRQFGAMDLTKLTNQKSDDVFFDWIGTVFMAYGQFWVIPGEILVSVALFALIFVSIRRGELRRRALLLASLWSILFLALIPAVLAPIYWTVSRALSGRIIVADSQSNSLLLIGLLLLGVCTGTLLFTASRRHFAVHELSLAGLIVLCVFSWVVALVLPAGSYVLFWPLFVTVVALLAAAIRGVQSTLFSSAAALLGMAATVLIFAPILYLLYIFLTLQLITAICAGLLIGAAFVLCGPFLEIAIPQTSWRLIGVILAASALISIGAGIMLSKASPTHPRRDSILYSLNADERTGAWISYDKLPDAWTSRVFAHTKPSRMPAPDYLAGFSRPVLFSPTVALDLKPPAAEIQADQVQDGVRTLRMKVVSDRNAPVISMIFAEGTHPVSLKIAGRILPFAQNAGFQSVRFYGMGVEGAQLELTFSASPNVSFWLIDQTAGLPVPVERRPDDLIMGDGSDVTLVCRRYNL